MPTHNHIFAIQSRKAWYLKVAQDTFGENESGIDIRDKANVVLADNGAWVCAWLWIPESALKEGEDLL